MDVKIEGKNVCRHIDITTSNHNCPPPATPPLPTMEGMATSADIVNADKCPCCGEATHHWQKSDAGVKFEPISEQDFWQKRIDNIKSVKYKAKMQKTMKNLLEAKENQRKLRSEGKPACPNVSEKDGERCGTFLDVPIGAKASYPSSGGGISTKSVAQVQKRFFDSAAKAAVAKAWLNAQTHDGNKAKVRAQTQLNHSTPGIAGGCNSPSNVIPDTLMAQEACNNIEAWQSTLEMLQ
jgi:hypothetical protein